MVFEDLYRFVLKRDKNLNLVEAALETYLCVLSPEVFSKMPYQEILCGGDRVEHVCKAAPYEVRR